MYFTIEDISIHKFKFKFNISLILQRATVDQLSIREQDGINVSFIRKNSGMFLSCEIKSYCLLTLPADPQLFCLHF